MIHKAAIKALASLASYAPPAGEKSRYIKHLLTLSHSALTVHDFTICTISTLSHSASYRMHFMIVQGCEPLWCSTNPAPHLC